LLRLATRSVEYGKYDEAINILTTNTINESEGAREMQNAYINAFTLRSLEYIRKAKFDKAIKDIETAMAYPGASGRPQYAKFYYLLGNIYKKSGEKAKADDFFQKTLDIKIDKDGSDLEYQYYKGLALEESGKPDEAKQLFQSILNNVVNKKEGSAFFTQFEGGQSRDVRIATNHFLTGLAYEGLKEKGKAKTEFTEALKVNPGLIWSKIHLDSL